MAAPFEQSRLTTMDTRALDETRTPHAASGALCKLEGLPQFRSISLNEKSLRHNEEAGWALLPPVPSSPPELHLHCMVALKWRNKQGLEMQSAP